MAYRFDDDLEFLGKLQSKDLDDLVYCLIHDTDGKERLTNVLGQILLQLYLGAERG